MLLFLISHFNETAFSTVDSHSYFMSETETSVRFVFIYFSSTDAQLKVM